MVKGKRKTKKITIRDLAFFDERKEIKKEKKNLHLLYTATSVSVTFILQKNNNRYATITQQTSRKELDPVRTWANVVSRILGSIYL